MRERTSVETKVIRMITPPLFLRLLVAAVLVSDGTFPACDGFVPKRNGHLATARIFPHRIPAGVFTASAATPDHSVADNPAANNGKKDVLVKSNFFGDIARIRLEGEEEDESGYFLGTMAVPTFGASSAFDASQLEPTTKPRRGLEGVLNQGPAFVLDNVLPQSICEDIIETCETLHFGNFNAGKNHHGAMQILVSQSLANGVGKLVSRHVNVQEVLERHEEMIAGVRERKGGTPPPSGDDDDNEKDLEFVYAGLNRRWRIYRYAPGGEETFSPHIDCGFPPSGLSKDGSTMLWDDSSLLGEKGEVVSRLTILMYLNDDFVGGETKFYEPAQQTTKEGSALIGSVRPKAGSVLVFPQAVTEEAAEYAEQYWPAHEGSPVESGNRPKYVIRSDILFRTQENIPYFEEKDLCRYDQVVSAAFTPQSPVYDNEFVQHLSSLYSPYMGAENLGPFLYSFLRFTKKRRIVEIGAGYTSLWILQALKDNEDELERVRILQRQGQCRLMDVHWTVPDLVEEYDGATKVSLLCVDNCLHQSESASGATAVAHALGLENNFQFVKGDAFELDLFLEKDSIDVLWCDFGVGSRMSDFASRAWPSLAPGGYLMCHSTLTNQNTRDWLEAIRTRQSEDKTGIPPDEYVELSLLEPYKHYQNAISILQKRKDYKEPLYSQYA